MGVTSRLGQEMESPFSSEAGSSRAASALIVGANLAHVLSSVSALSDAGFQVTVVGTFQEAKAILQARPPTVLVTELRLGEYNGLHLVLRAKSIRPAITTLVTTDFRDAVLETEAEQLGAVFVVTPTTREDLLAAVFRSLFQTSTGEATEPIRPPFERRKAERRKGGRTAAFQGERRQSERRRDILGLIRRAAVS